MVICVGDADADSAWNTVKSHQGRLQVQLITEALSSAKESRYIKRPPGRYTTVKGCRAACPLFLRWLQSLLVEWSSLSFLPYSQLALVPAHLR